MPASKKTTKKSKKPKRRTTVKGARPTPYKLTAERKAEFCELLRDDRSVTHAARAIGVSTRHLYRIRKEDEEFAAEWDDAWNSIIDELEASAMKRAIHGHKKSVTSMGEVVGEDTVYETQLTTFMLKSNRREKYSDKLDVTVSPQEYGEEVRKFLEQMDASAKEALGDSN